MQQFTGVIFRDVEGAALCASGVGTLRSSMRKNITKDELFALCESHPQVTLTNIGNNKFVSIKQGMDVSANQNPMEPDEDSPPDFIPYSNREVFQVEIDKKTNHWAILSSQHKLWQVNAPGAKAAGVTACCENSSCPDIWFEAFWNELDSSLSLKSVSNNCWVKANPTGALQATTTTLPLTDRERFFVDIVNRPLAVFRCAFGFIGLLSNDKTTSSKGIAMRLDCSRVTYDIFEPIRIASGLFVIKALQNGNFWRVVDGDSSVVADSDNVESASWFRFEFCRAGRVAIRLVNRQTLVNGEYLVGEQSGLIVAKGKSINDNTLWEM